MALALTDIRCRCGGLCDSTEPCSMRGNVEPCRCGVTPVHGARQHTFAIGNQWLQSARASRGDYPCLGSS